MREIQAYRQTVKEIQAYRDSERYRTDSREIQAYRQTVRDTDIQERYRRIDRQ